MYIAQKHVCVFFYQRGKKVSSPLFLPSSFLYSIVIIPTENESTCLSTFFYFSFYHLTRWSWWWYSFLVVCEIAFYNRGIYMIITVDFYTCAFFLFCCCWLLCYFVGFFYSDACFYNWGWLWWWLVLSTSQLLYEKDEDCKEQKNLSMNVSYALL